MVRQGGQGCQRWEAPPVVRDNTAVCSPCAEGGQGCQVWGYGGWPPCHLGSMRRAGQSRARQEAARHAARHRRPGAAVTTQQRRARVVVAGCATCKQMNRVSLNNIPHSLSFRLTPHYFLLTGPQGLSSPAAKPPQFRAAPGRKRIGSCRRRLRASVNRSHVRTFPHSHAYPRASVTRSHISCSPHSSLLSGREAARRQGGSPAPYYFPRQFSSARWVKQRGIMWADLRTHAACPRPAAAARCCWWVFVAGGFREVSAG
jgi:hypothetical protein